MILKILGLSGAEVSAWVAAIAGSVALVMQLSTVFKARRREQSQIEEALDRQPLVRQQLELGNVGEAVKQLNAIIAAQSRHMEAQDRRQTASNQEIDQLKQHIDALESESAGWEKQAREAKAETESCRADIEEMKKTYARSLAQLREEIHRGPHDPPKGRQEGRTNE